jgi:hypothetical protein
MSACVGSYILKIANLYLRYLVRTKKLMDLCSSYFGSRKSRFTAVGIRFTDHAIPSIRNS